METTKKSTVSGLVLNHIFFVNLDNALVYLYTGAFIFYLLFRGFDGAALTLIVLVPFEYFMRDVREPLKSFYGATEYASYVWYNFWIMCYLLYLYVMYLLHKRLGLTVTKLYLFVSYSFGAIVILQFIAFIDAITIYSDLVSYVYAFGLNAINLSVFIFAVYSVVFHGNDVKARNFGN